ncbi:Maf family protein [Alteromonas genovensis]|uniref:Maf family protein n=1 Tax=Alteromonas genovensis TaxID=471225 RepID=UPI002FE1B1F8
MTTLILASSSQYRKKLLADIGLHVETMSPDIDETPKPDETALTLSKRLAQEKALKVSARVSNDEAIVIGSDQVAFLATDDGPILLGKPLNVGTAVQQLKLCQGKTVSFFTAICVYQASSDTLITDVEETRVHFRENTTSLLQGYVEKERPLDCAGSFKSEGMGILLFERVEGRDPNSLIGLPIMLLNDILSSHFNTNLLEMATR